MPLLCGIMLLFTLLRLPYLFVLPRPPLHLLLDPFIFLNATIFQTHRFLLRRKILHSSLMRIRIIRIVYLSSNLVLYFLIQKRRYSRDGNWRDGLLAFRSNTPLLCCSVHRSAFLSNGIKMKYKRSL